MKKLEDLAILGGDPAFAEPQHVGAPNLGDRARLMERIEDILDRRWFTNNGTYVQAFERHVAEVLGVRHCIATSSGTVALELAIRALGLEGEVIVPSFTFIATAHALQWQEIKPVFCDIDPETHHLDPGEVESLITSATTGILPVHTWAAPCAVEALVEIAERHRLELLFDAAGAFGSTHRGQKVGNFGSAECFSFHATKLCTSFEGGAITTNDDALAEKLRLMRNFGFDGPDRVIHIGTNGKMSEVAAAMGITSLESMDEFIDVNRRNYEAYCDGLASIDGIDVYRYPADESVNHQYVVTMVDEAELGLSRDEVVRVLEAENVRARRYFYPGCHRMEPYRSTQPQAGLVLPHTEAVAAGVLILPTGTNMSVEKVRRVCDLMASIAAHAPKLRAQLEEPAGSDAHGELRPATPPADLAKKPAPPSRVRGT